MEKQAEHNIPFELDELDCPCWGTGWAESPQGNWVECPCHFEGQLHPQSSLLLLDQPARLKEEERRARINFQIKTQKSLIDKTIIVFKEQKLRLDMLELELVRNTSTVRVMPAVRPEDWAK
jgi:hypothetical protein